MARVLLIGIDGATWDLLKPWVGDGKLPILARLMKEGCWGHLESTVPPVTIPAWISLATGLNPGKIGAYDFLSRKDNSYRLHPATSAHFRRKAVWDYIASDKDKKIGIVNYPGLFPIYEINGFVVSKTALFGPEDVFFPQSLEKELDRVCHGYDSFVAYHEKKYDDTELFLNDLHRVLSKQVAAVRYLLGQPWDLFIYVLSASDWVQHLIWKYIDSAHPCYDSKESNKYGDGLLKFWQRVDDFLGEIIEATKEANLFLVSDHGFGCQDECFSLAKWLEMKGYLVRKSSRGRRVYTRMKNVTMSCLKRLGEMELRKAVPDSFVRGVWSRIRVNITDQIDFSRSRAYVLGHTIPFGGIYINREGRDPQGLVRQSEYEALKSEIVSSLKDLKADVGKDIKVKIFDTKDIYWGPYVQYAPDIIFAIDDWRCIINEERFNDALFKNEPYSSRHTGSHRMNGIFLAYGPDIGNAGEEIDGLGIYDIAPTILHMFELPIPQEMDGKVLKEIFKESSNIARRPIEYQASAEEERIKAKIRKLKALKNI